MTSSITKRLTFVAMALLVTAFLFTGLWFINSNSQTYDEAAHVTAGYSYLTTADFRLNPEHPPLIKELCALPVYLRYRPQFNPNPELWEIAGRGDANVQWPIGRSFLYDSELPADEVLKAARVPNLLLGCVLVALVGWWAYRLWGEWAGVVAAALAAFEPNLIAHAALVTTDLGVTLFIFLAVYLLWEYTRAPSLPLLVGCGAAVGGALLAKYSAALLPAIIAAVLFLYLLTRGELALPPRVKLFVGSRWACGALALLTICAVAALVIPCGYLFQGYHGWWDGLMELLRHREVGRYGVYYLMGEYSTQGWLSYFLVAFLIKTPIATLALIAASLLFYRAGKPLGRDAIFLLVPVVIFFTAMTLARVNIGLRHVLPIYPFLIVAAARVTTMRHERAQIVPLVLTLLVALTAFSSLRAAPHHLAYFNELIGGPEQGHLYLAKTDIDWGQDLKNVKRYMEREGVPIIYLSYFGPVAPDYYGINHQYVPSRPPRQAAGLRNAPLVPRGAGRELLAISVNNLYGLHFSDRYIFSWLAALTPVDKIDYSIFVYDITNDARAHAGLAEAYLKEQLIDHARYELAKSLAIDPNNAYALRLRAQLK